MTGAVALLFAASTVYAQVAVSWTVPRNGRQESMLVANGDVEAAVWTETAGQIILELGKNGALDEKALPRRLGRVRLRLTPDPSSEDASIPGVFGFTQDLRTSDGFIDIMIGNTAVAVWVDVNRPVTHVEISSSKERTLDVALEEQTGEIAAGTPGRIVWRYRNRAPEWPRGLADLGVNRTFGGAIEGAGLVSGPPGFLRSRAPAKRFVVNLHALAAQTPSVEAWRQRLDAQVARTNAARLSQARASHLSKWQQVWQRSHIHLPAQPDVERNFSLTRYTNLCRGRGEFPLGFDAWQWPRVPLTPYWTTFTLGDFELMRPLLRLYTRPGQLDDLGKLSPHAAGELAALLKEYQDYSGEALPEPLSAWLKRAPLDGKEPETDGIRDFGGQDPNLSMLALERMLIRMNGDKPQWLNDWPKPWESALFRVFLPGRRVAEGEIAGRELVRLRVDGR